MKNRSERRHHKFRMRDRALRIVKETWPRSIREGRMNWAIRNADHLKSCSCYMCCNPRDKKSYVSGEEKLTLQERKHLMDTQQQLMELENEHNESSNTDGVGFDDSERNNLLNKKEYPSYMQSWGI